MNIEAAYLLVMPVLALLACHAVRVTAEAFDLPNLRDKADETHAATAELLSNGTGST